MRWYELSIHTVEDNEDVLAAYLNTISKGVSIEYSVDVLRQRIDDFDDFDDKFRLDPNDYPDSDVKIIVYFDETVDIDDEVSEIEAFINDTPLADKDDIHITRRTIEESDWENEWKKYFHSFRVSKDFVIIPSWELDDYDFRTGDKPIRLDPGMAFGTGDHPTTGMCLKFIEDHVTTDQKIIDVGTGSGILTIGAHLMGARDLKATDIDKLSIKVAGENFELNGCVEDVNLETGDLLKDETEHYDIVIANILAHIIDGMIEDAYESLNDDGMFIASGIIRDKRDEIVERMEQSGFTAEEILEDGGWVSILARKG